MKSGETLEEVAAGLMALLDFEGFWEEGVCKFRKQIVSYELKILYLTPLKTSYVCIKMNINTKVKERDFVLKFC